MSGGHYDYVQFRLESLNDDIKYDLERVKEILGSKQPDLFFEPDEDLVRDLEVTEKLTLVLSYLVHELDWFMSGDTGIDNYRQRLNAKGVDAELITALQAVLKGLKELYD